MTVLTQFLLWASLVVFAIIVFLVFQKNIHIWLLGYLGTLLRQFRLRNAPVTDIYVCVADHFEPYNGGVGQDIARTRVDAWFQNYPAIATKYIDSYGNHPCVTFFYPEEEYDPAILDKLAELSRSGIGDVEIHLHHDSDTAEGLTEKLNKFKSVLHEKHGLLRLDENGEEIIYAFIHGNWALDNSRPDGSKCGVSNELQVLVDTGCYMDMTLPSAPSPTQTTKINSIYFAKGVEGKNKSHDTGRDVRVGDPWNGKDELLMVQGPLAFNFFDRKFGILPRIEASELSVDALPTRDRLSIWTNCRIAVSGSDDTIFIKLHTHGAEDRNIQALLNDGGLDRLWKLFDELRVNNEEIRLHYVSAYGMYRVIKKLAN